MAAKTKTKPAAKKLTVAPDQKRNVTRKASTAPRAKRVKETVVEAATEPVVHTRMESSTPEALIAESDVRGRANTAPQAKQRDIEFRHPFGTCVPFGECVCGTE